MKLKFFIINVCVLLSSVVNVQAKNISLTEAGTLSAQISDEELNTLTELSITGPINGDDILIIRAMGGTLKTLNLKEAKIVKGGASYYLTNYYTQDDVVGDFMFYAMTALTKIVLPKDVWSIGSWNDNYSWNSDKTKLNGSPRVINTQKDDTSFGCASFTRCVNLKEIELPATLIYIGNKAFSYCKLSSIVIPEGVEYMGGYTFHHCKELTTVSIPSTLGNKNKIENDLYFSYMTKSDYWQINDSDNGRCGFTFSDCPQLSNVTLAEGIKYLTPYMFDGCSSLSTITLPNTIERLNSSFVFCSGLTELSLPSNLVQGGSFYGCKKLTSIIIPNTVTQSGTERFSNELSFEECSSLTSIKLSDNMSLISAAAFRGCVALETITIPNNITTIGEYAFFNCNNLKSVTLSNNLSTLGGWAFENCTSLSEINITDKVTVINNNCFKNTALKKLTLPRSVTIIGENAFEDCKELTHINFPPNVTDIKSYTFQNCVKLANIELPNGLISIQDYAFNGCSSLGKVTIPGGVQTISSGAFQNSGLTEVILKEGVINLSSNSFSGCNLLKTVTFPPSMKTISGFNNTGIKNILFAEGSAPEAIGAGAFENCDSLETITLPNSIKKIGKRAFYSCDTLQSITLPNAIDSILTSTFSYCRSLKSIIIPEGVKGIQETAFFNCKSLASVTFPSTLSYLGENSFRNTALITVTIPEGVKDLYYGTFAKCDSLVSVKLPKSLTQIHNGPTSSFNVEGEYCESGSSGAFSFCQKLETVDLSETPLAEIANCTFYECNKLRNIDLSASKLEEIKEYVFYSCDSLRTVQFPATLTTISKWAFNSCSSLSSLTFPTGFKTLREEVFTNCRKIKSIDLSATSLTTIKNWFANTDSLRTVKLPETIISLEEQAFYNCPIQDINLPTALTSIGKYALNKSQLNNLTIPSKVSSIGEYAFENGTYDQVVIPNSVTSIGNNAFYSTRIKSSLEITPSESIQLGNSAFRCYGSYYENGNYIYYHLPNVYWNSSAQFPKDKFGQIDNLYLPTDGTVSSKDNIGYIFFNGMTDSIAIAYSNNRYSVNKAMKTKKVTYTRDFNQTSGYGEAAGWQTIVLPFDVKEITYSKRYSQEQETISLAPFGSAALETAGTLPFWLYELGTDGKYKAATEIKAHQAYLICMPNNDKYPSENNINGEVKFAASDATNGITLGTTQGVLKRSKGTKFDLVPTYEGVLQHDTVYVLNENRWYSGNDKEYPAGSVFIKNYTESYSNNPAVYPFRAYLVTNEGKTSVASAPMFYSIGGGDGTITGIEDVPFATPDKATKAYSRNGVLYINTDADRTINIYDVTGRTVRIIEAREGVNEVHGLDSGIYLLEGQKVAVGR